MHEEIDFIQARLHEYLAPHDGEWPTDLDDDRGCAGCRLIARHLWSKGVSVTPAPHERTAEHRVG